MRDPKRDSIESIAFEANAAHFYAARFNAVHESDKRMARKFHWGNRITQLGSIIVITFSYRIINLNLFTKREGCMHRIND